MNHPAIAEYELEQSRQRWKFTPGGDFVTRSGSISSRLEEAVLQYLEKNGATSVRQLRTVLLTRYPTLTRLETTDLLWRLAGEDQVEFEYSGRRFRFSGTLLAGSATLVYT